MKIAKIILPQKLPNIQYIAMVCKNRLDFRPNKVFKKFLVLLPGQFFAKQKHTDKQTDNHKETL